MRDFEGLQARIAAGEHISWSEMEEKYRPLKADYARVAQWLAEQGFEATLTDSTHTNLFVRASVARVSKAFAVRMARVAAIDGEYTAAVSPPYIPMEIADLVLSVNGLQPQFRLRHVKYAPPLAAPMPADVVGNAGYVTPDNIAAAYQFPAALDGAGNTIAILDGIAARMSDLAAFWVQANVAQNVGNVTVVSVNGTTDSDPGAPIESAADVEWAGALAPGAKIRQYVVNDPLLGLSSVLNDLAEYPNITVVSVSYGRPEAATAPGYILSISQSLAQLAAAGVTVFASSGDGGSNSTQGTYGSYSATAPLYVSYPASDVDVTGVGGTQLDFDATWNVTGETVWSDMASTLSASGGGVSMIFQRPSWQSGGAVLAGQSMRCVPDVAAISVALAPAAGIPQGNDTVLTGEFMALTVLNGQNFGFAGTSLATPVWAAVGALINQARSEAGHSPIGLLGPNLYPLVGTSALTDITSGTNGAYAAGPGYDLCTGLGSPNVTKLVAALTSAVAPSTFFSPSVPMVGASVQAPISAVVGGSTVTMTISDVTSTIGPVTYQWTLDGEDIPGATSDIYTIASVRGNDRGTFAVQVANYAGTLTFSMGTLTVLAPSVSITAAAPSAVVPGSSFTMSVSAESSGGPLAYQWTFNGVNIPGADQPSLAVSNISATNAGDYSIAITDSNGLTVVDLGYLTLNGPNYLTPYSFTTFEGGISGAAALAVDTVGNLYVADKTDCTIQRITPGGIVTTLAGSSGVKGSADGVGSSATFNTPEGIAVDSGGTVYVADTGNSTIRMITGAGIVSTLAGTAGVVGSADGTGPAATFYNPFGIAVDKNGDLYIADTNNSTIRVIHAGGVVTTLAGTPRSSGIADGTGRAAQFAVPQGVSVDAGGNVYVADTFNDTIRKITPDGQVTTLAGNAGTPGAANGGVAGSTDGTGVAALFSQPDGVAAGSDGNVYVADTGNSTIRKITPSGVVTTIAGVPGMRGASDGTGSTALFSIPAGAAMSAGAVLFVADGTIRIGILAAAAVPTVLTQPLSQTIASGTTVTFGVSESGLATFQWYLNGVVVSGATDSILLITGATATNAGNYTCILTNSQGSITTEPATLTVVGTTDPGRLINLSCRADVGTGANALIVGFAIGGPSTSGPESVLIRASGPALSPFGVAGVLPDPYLRLYNSSNLIDSNAGWAGTASLKAAFAQVGAFAWPNPSSLDSALFETLATASYSAVISGATNDSGVALAEIYDATLPGAYTPTTLRLVNLSSRVKVGSGANILIAGFVIGGSTSKTVLIRGSGPALSAFGVPGVLPDPQLQLNNSTGTIASNAGWGGNMQLAAVADSVGAFSWGSAPTPDSALLVTLPPGGYTVEVAGSSGDTGVALVEVYEVP
jgi:sugar lactone lactonase YvrE